MKRISPEVERVIFDTIDEVMASYPILSKAVRPDEDYYGSPVIIAEVEYGLRQDPAKGGERSHLIGELMQRLSAIDEERFVELRERFAKGQTFRVRGKVYAAR